MNLKSVLTLVAGVALVAGSGAALASEQLAQKGGCLACHKTAEKVVGPSYKDVAAKYKGQGDAVAKLSAKVRGGSTGVWGSIPMPPNGADKLSDAEVKTVVTWILAQ